VASVMSGLHGQGRGPISCSSVASGPAACPNDDLYRGIRPANSQSRVYFKRESSEIQIYAHRRIPMGGSGVISRRLYCCGYMSMLHRHGRTLRSWSGPFSPSLSSSISTWRDCMSLENGCSVGSSFGTGGRKA